MAQKRPIPRINDQSINTTLVRTILNNKSADELLDIIIFLLPQNSCMEYIEVIAGLRPNMNSQWVEQNRNKLYDIMRKQLEKSGYTNISCLYIRNNNYDGCIGYDTPSVIALAYKEYYISDNPEVKEKLLENAEKITSEENLSNIRSGKSLYDCMNDVFKGLSWRDYGSSSNNEHNIPISVPVIIDMKMNINDINDNL